MHVFKLRLFVFTALCFITTRDKQVLLYTDAA